MRPTANSSAADKKIVVGFSQIGAESGWRTANTESIKSEAARRGIELKFADAQQKQENQIKALRSFIAQGVDVIVFSPVVVTGWEPVLREIKKAGIPVVLSDRAVEVTDDALYVTFIGSDFVEEGRRAAVWLAKATDGKAVIAELVGTPGSASRQCSISERSPESISWAMTLLKSLPSTTVRDKSPRCSLIMTTWRWAQFRRWKRPG